MRANVPIKGKVQQSREYNENYHFVNNQIAKKEHTGHEFVSSVEAMIHRVALRTRAFESSNLSIYQRGSTADKIRPVRHGSGTAIMSNI